MAQRITPRATKTTSSSRPLPQKSPDSSRYGGGISTELTGPNVYRFVDHEKPTLFVDDADTLFRRKSDLAHIFNASWTRGTKIPRQVNGVTVWFDPFCPKAIGLVGLDMPRTLASRSIIIKLWPKKANEKVESFFHADDAEFGILRRKLARWSADHAVALKDARPLLPANFNNRAAANWRLLLAIAELAGEPFPKDARNAAERYVPQAELVKAAAGGLPGNLRRRPQGDHVGRSRRLANQRPDRCLGRIQAWQRHYPAAGR
jgi:hypothetical protein